MEVRSKKVFSVIECQLGILAGLAAGDSERVNRWDERLQMDTSAEDIGDLSLWPIVRRLLDRSGM